MVKCAMVQPPLFIDDAPVAQVLDDASALAVAHLAALFPELAAAGGAAARVHLRRSLAGLLLGEGLPAALPPLVRGPAAFGDPFDLAALPLPRAADGYGVQILGTDTLLDRRSGSFLPVRDAALDGLYPSFAAAFAAAKAWVKANPGESEPPLAIVPASFDQRLGRHVLIYGVLPTAP